MRCSTREMAKKWNVSERTAAKYCKSGKVPGAMKISNQWLIPCHAIRPPTDRSIQRILLLTLQLKSNPEYEIHYPSTEYTMDELPLAYGYLAETGFIELPPAEVPAARIPYEASLTEQGMKLLESVIGSEANAGEKNGDLQKIVMSWGPAVIHLITEIIKAASP